MQPIQRYPSESFTGKNLNLILQLMLLAAVILLIYPPDERYALYGEFRLISLVCIGGALGSSMRYSGILFTQKRHKYGFGKLAELIQRLLSGVPLAALVYLVIRGVVLNTNVRYEAFNAYGLTIISLIAGFFSYETLNKLTKALQYFVERDHIIEDKIEKISGALGLDVLGNYHGFFAAELRSSPPAPDRGLYDPLRYQYRLVCRFLPLKTARDRSDAENLAEIDISGGKEVEDVTFLVVPRIKNQKFEPLNMNIKVSHEYASEEFVFSFTSHEGYISDCWIEISQMNRLVAVVSPVRQETNGV